MRLRRLAAALLGATSVLAGCAPLPPATGGNKELVISFYTTVFIQKKVAEGFATYVGPSYIQHNPRLPDGPDAAVRLLSQALTPDSLSEIKRVVAEGDLVMLHVHSRSNPSDRGRAVVDIFRVENGKIVEHWDVVQPVPEQSANRNTMF